MKTMLGLVVTMDAANGRKATWKATRARTNIPRVSPGMTSWWWRPRHKRLPRSRSANWTPGVPRKIFRTTAGEEKRIKKTEEDYIGIFIWLQNSYIPLFSRQATVPIPHINNISIFYEKQYRYTCVYMILDILRRSRENNKIIKCPVKISIQISLLIIYFFKVLLLFSVNIL